MYFMIDHVAVAINEKEVDIINKIDSEVFFAILNEQQVDLSYFYLDSRNLNPIEVMKFNKSLLVCKKRGLSILDCLAVLEKNYFTVSKIMDLINDKIRKILRREIKERIPYLKMPHNTLSSFFATK